MWETSRDTTPAGFRTAPVQKEPGGFLWSAAWCGESSRTLRPLPSLHLHLVEWLDASVTAVGKHDGPIFGPGLPAVVTRVSNRFYRSGSMPPTLDSTLLSGELALTADQGIVNGGSESSSTSSSSSASSSSSSSYAFLLESG